VPLKYPAGTPKSVLKYVIISDSLLSIERVLTKPLAYFHDTQLLADHTAPSFLHEQSRMEALSSDRR
jgi:hypothetical protein